ncbi:MAG: molybdopterin molybdotransferase MoeA, partial [Burkholderiaceae bacterium]
MKHPPLKPFDEALAELLARATPLPGRDSVATWDADGRVLAVDAVSPLHVPPQDNSAMDGYALRCADVPAAGTVLRVAQRIAAGSSGQPLQPGTAARIFTGAPVPPGADAVVMQEDCEALPESGDGAPASAQVPTLGRVRIHTVPEPGQAIRRAGEDIARGAVVLRAGTRLTPAALGLAASIGMDKLQVVQRPRVALFSTGDELVMPGELPPERMPAGAIYNSNRFFLRALLQRLGCLVTDLGIVPDEREATVTALRTASAQHDVILTSGGVSVGEEDHVKPAVQALGRLDLWQIAIKPGKP